MNHREYVGGGDPKAWHNIGKLQYHFLVAAGLQPRHRFLDIACGSLRLGQWLIPMLQKGNYYGLEANGDILEAGKKLEMKSGVMEMKSPQFSVNGHFDFSFLRGQFDYAIAQSLFTHLTPVDIKLCLFNLRSFAHLGSRFYFTFFRGKERENPAQSHPHKNFIYHFEELEEMASGWKLEDIGDWGHPVRQQLVLAIPC